MALTDTNVTRAIMGLGMTTPQIMPEPAEAGTFAGEDALAIMNGIYYDPTPDPTSAVGRAAGLGIHTILASR